jgi:hypothetical protein
VLALVLVLVGVEEEVVGEVVGEVEVEVVVGVVVEVVVGWWWRWGNIVLYPNSHVIPSEFPMSCIGFEPNS